MRRARVLYGSRGRFTGSILPAVKGARVEVVGPGGTIARTKTRANGGFKIAARVRSVGPFQVRVAGIASDAGDRSAAAARSMPSSSGPASSASRCGSPRGVLPAAGGTVTAVVWRNGHRAFEGPVGSGVPLRTSKPASYRVRLDVQPADGYLPASAKLTAAVLRPVLVYGSRGAAVRALQQRLRELHYALPAVDGAYSLTTYQAVLAFQSVAGLPRTGRIDARTWRRLVNADVPRARYPGEPPRDQQGPDRCCYAVRNGRVQLVVHVSTGATGNTPLGHFHIYRKVVGWDWVLWYPMYFLRGFAVHGYPEVPSYPGLARVRARADVGRAAALRRFFFGESVYIYW